MKTRCTTLSAGLLLMAALLSGACLAKDNTRESSLRAAELARFAANVAADGPALEKLLDANLEYSHSNGKLDSRSSFIASLADGSLDYHGMEPDIQSLRIFGDVGVIRGFAKVRVSMRGTTSEFTIGYTDIWLWKDGRWQMTEWRSARMPDAPAK